VEEPLSEPLLIRRLLFGLAVGAAVLLLLAVLVAPWFDDGQTSQQTVALFARDAALRRTSIASAIGLLVTAWVFFRRRRLSSPAHRPPSSNAGA
jgi:hypothetical protein